jgi:cytochrome b
MLVLIGLRVVWGLVGSEHARFSDFLFSPTRTMDYLRSLRSGRPRHYLGHNPAGGWMVVALLLSLAVAAVSGVMMGGAEDEVLEEVHEAFANLSLLLVVVHVSGVVVSSLLHRENLVKAMLTGFKMMRRNADV